MVSVYFINELATDNYKIGITNNTTRRLRELQTANKRPLVLRGTIDYRTRGKAKATEKFIHKSLSGFNLSGEWFVLPDDALDVIAQEFDFNQAERLGEM